MNYKYSNCGHYTMSNISQQHELYLNDNADTSRKIQPQTQEMPEKMLSITTISTTAVSCHTKIKVIPYMYFLHQHGANV